MNAAEADPVGGGEVVALTAWDKAAFAVFGLLALALGAGGFSLSFAPVTREMEPAFGSAAWRVPAIVDLSVFVFSALDVLLARLRMGHPLLRLIPLAGTGATIMLNASIGGGVAATVAHIAMPSTWVAFVEVARHVVRHRARLAAGRRREGIPAARFLAAPLRSALLWRRMVLWEVRTYDEAIRRELRRLDTIAALRDAYGRAWRLKVGKNARLRLGLGLIGPDQALALAAGDSVGEIGDLQPDPASQPRRRAARPSARAHAEPSAPSARGQTDPRAVLADAVYLAYQQAGRPLEAQRLRELTGYSRRSAFRARSDLAARHGKITVREGGDDEQFAAALAARIASGWPAAEREGAAAA